MIALLDRLCAEGKLSAAEFETLLTHRDTLRAEVISRADAVRRKSYGTDVYIRGLVEVSNICKNDCYYCGIRRSNTHVARYRLSAEEILSSCAAGYRLGFRTFVLQGGEDGTFSDTFLTGLLREIKGRFPDCAVTLSLGERSDESYAALRKAGADRYLLRHEAHSAALYGKLHPAELSHENRMRCLKTLRRLGYQVGAGFMVGAPFQTIADLAQELCFLADFRPEMVGIGPFLPQHDTPFRDKPAGTAELTVFLLGLIRLMLPQVLLPATTALNSVSPDGRVEGLRAGANVIMPNLSPENARTNYQLYDNKKSTGLESAEALDALKAQVAAAGYQIVCARGDYAAAGSAQNSAEIDTKIGACTKNEPV